MALDLGAWFKDLLRRASGAGELAQKGHYAHPQVDAAKQLATLDVHPEWAGNLARSANGYVREGALRHLQSTPGPVALTAALDRLNDWVPQVRLVAREIFLAHLSARRVDDLLACITHLYLLQHKTRTNHAELLERTAALLTEEQYRHQFVQTFHQSRGKVARLLLEWLLKHADSTAVIHEGLMHADPSVRAKALAAVAMRPAHEQKSCFELALKDRSASIRTSALRLAMSANSAPAERMAYCEPMLLDASAGVRSTARWYADKLGFDLGAFDQSAVLGPLSVGQLTALLWEGAKGSPAIFAQLAEANLAHAKASVRLAALRLLLIQFPERRLSLINAAWSDPSLKLKRAVLDMLLRDFVLEGKALNDMAWHAWKRGDLTVANTITRRLGMWPQLVMALRLSQHADTRELGLQELAKFDVPFNGLMYSKPYPDERDAVRALLEDPLIESRLEAHPHVLEGLKRAGLWQNT